MGYTIVLDPNVPTHLRLTISAAGVFLATTAGRREKAYESRAALQAELRGPGRRGRPLRPQYHHAPFMAGRALHAEALGRHAQRRCRRVVA